MTIKTKRWDDPVEADDGFRLLVCRYRPRRLPKSQETWDAWDADLGPSTELHAAFFGKRGSPVAWAVYRNRYLLEMHQQKNRIAALAQRVRQGETITLLCSSHCVNEPRCHRTLLKMLIENEMKKEP